MSDDAKAAPKKKGGLKKKLLLGVGVLAVLGLGVGGGVYAATSGLVGGGGGAHGEEEDPNKPKLVKKGEEGHAAAEGEGEGGGHGGGDAEASGGGTVTKGIGSGTGGEPYQSTYFQMDKEFTANLKDSPHFVQVGLALSTNYDDRVIANVKGNIIPVRSAILLALAGTDEEAVFTPEGKKALAENLKRAINDVLIQKEGFGGIGNVYFTTFIVQ
jgi:flagellar protein FliL